MKALHFGAGNIGKGFIGYLLNKTGYDVCFVDVNQEMIDRFNANNRYYVEILDHHRTVEEVSPVTALNSLTQEKKVIDAIVHADLITTSVGVNNFASIAEIIAKGLLRREVTGSKIDIIANENAINASSSLKKEIAKQVSEKEMESLSSFVGFPNAAVDRVALNKDCATDESVAVESDYEWVINKSEMVNLNLPFIEGALYVEDLKPFIERKLFLVNMGHATTAYIGFLFGKHTIQEALKNNKIEQFLRGALQETSQYFISTLNIEPKILNQYIEKTISRFENENISDDIFRVGRDPIRKMSYHERLIKPTRELYDMGFSVEHLSLTIAACFLFDNPKDESSVVIQNYIKEHSLYEAIAHFTALESEDLKVKIKSYYEQLKTATVNELEEIITNNLGGE